MMASRAALDEFWNTMSPVFSGGNSDGGCDLAEAASDMDSQSAATKTKRCRESDGQIGRFMAASIRHEGGSTKATRRQFLS
jgi:hypothetical protein